MKKEVGGRAQTYSVILTALAITIFVAYLSSVIATQTIFGIGGSGVPIFTNASILEDRNQLLNISINNTDFNQTGGVTGVTIELPSGLVFTADTQNVSSNPNNTFSNTTTVLNWSNTTEFLVNGSVDGSGTFGYFWFNVSATSPGLYNVVVRTFNATGEANYGNITVNVNDTTNSTGFNLPPSNGTGFHVLQWNNTGTTSSTINISGNFSDNFNLSSVALYVWNTTTLITPNETHIILNTTASNGTEVLANFTFTFPREGSYVFNFLVNDTANNSAFNDTGNFTIAYDITRPLMEFNDTEGGNSVQLANVTRNWTFVNVTVTETFEANITFTLYNSTALLNSTTFTSATRTINWTNLLDDWYRYNVTIVDIANNRNETTTRNITIDTTRPRIIFNDTSSGETSAHYANVSRNWTFVNVTVTEANQANITFELSYTNGTVVNSTTFTSATRTINWTNLAEGRYIYNVTITDYVNYVNTTVTRNITIDTTRPLMEFNDSVGGPTAAHYTNTTRTWIFVNVTASDTNEANITFTLYNSTGEATNVTTFEDSSVRTINWTGLANGNYTYNVTVTDYANNRNTTATRTIFIDTTGPSVSVAKTSSTKTTLTLTITATDAVSGVNTPCTTNRGGATVSGSTITESGLACSTSYAYDVTCNDFAGNAAVGSLSATTDSCSGGESTSSGGGGGGGSSTTTTTSTWASTVVPEKVLFETGYTRTLAPKERIRVDIGNTAHHAGVLEVTATTAKIQIASTPQEATLSVGESKNFEVTNDSIYDIKVTLVAIKDGKAEIIVKSIAESFDSSTSSALQETTSSEKEAETETTAESTAANNIGSSEEDSLSSNSGWIIWVVIIIVLILVVLAIIKRRRR